MNKRHDTLKPRKEASDPEYAEELAAEDEAETVCPFPFAVARQLRDDLNKKIRLVTGRDGSPSIVGCDGTLRYTKAWLHQYLNSPEEEENACRYLKEQGGYCDCEVLLNAIDEETWE